MQDLTSNLLMIDIKILNFTIGESLLIQGLILLSFMSSK